MTLPGGFRLPIAIAVERWVMYDTEPIIHSDPEGVLLPFMTNYLQSQMVAGKIVSAIHTVTYLDGICRVDGSFGCYEMIGRNRPEESLTDYENNRTDSER